MGLIKNIGCMPVSSGAYIDNKSNVFFKQKVDGKWRKISV